MESEEQVMGTVNEDGEAGDGRKRRSKSPVSNSEDSSTTFGDEHLRGGGEGKKAPLKSEEVEVEIKHDVKMEAKQLKKPEISMQDEIQQLAMKKREVLMKGKGRENKIGCLEFNISEESGDVHNEGRENKIGCLEFNISEEPGDVHNEEPGRWKEEIQKSIEREIERRVRDALETPPLERMRRNKHRAKLRKLQREKELEEQQKFLSLAECNSYAQNLPSLRLRYPWNDVNSSIRYYEMQESLCNEKQGNPQNYQQGPGFAGSNGLTDTMATASPTLQALLERTTNDGSDPQDDRDQFIADIKRKAYHRYTREGFKEALKRGKLKLKKIGNGKFMDKNGVILTADGPFWPPECGPLYPKQQHISHVPEEKELLSSDVPQETRTVDNQKTKWFRPWEGTQVVFDSERLSKGTVPHTTPEGCCQSLVFESRFESGNLRQARRIGQFEYDLVLKTDLYTNRHTQWFYFRVQKMVPGVTYKFNIVNLLKKDSLYNHGMRPLFYSEGLANSKGIGWHRMGHHITYSRNYNLSRNPLLHPEIAYYMLVWQMEFPEENDVCFLTHCYPFTFTDLCEHLDTICTDSDRKKHVKREVMCESRAGNSCFLLTVGNFGDKSKNKLKKGVVVTARVHPGETNSSWMMKGFLDFITSSDPVANNLRKAFTFKIVPMLNPDGVIVGNYRCSLSARDLNRNYRHPRKESFPTVWHLKNMLEGFGQETDVIAYCDLHGHSRKHNVFIYGCDQQGKEMDAATFLCQRLFPWLISKKAPDKFSFGGCKFQVRRCKESTGRVVMWRQMGISNSFTMEATFCGSKNIQTDATPRHFNTLDFQDMGCHFCEALLEYHKAQEDKSLHSEFILELTKVITHQVLTSRGLLPQNFNIFAKNLLAEHGTEQVEDVTALDRDVPNGKEGGDATTSAGKKKIDARNASSKNVSRSNSSKNHHQSSKAAKLKEKKQNLDSKIRSKLEALRFFDSMDSETIQGCINLIHELHVMSEFAESETSDSDSASESEIPVDPGEAEEGASGKKDKQKRRKGKKQKKGANGQGDVVEEEKTVKPRRKSSHDHPRPRQTFEFKESAQNSPPVSAGKFTLKKYTPYVNRYNNRSNNGIPMFSEERTQERALKRLEAMRRMERERLEKEASKVLQDDEYARLIALTRELQKREAEVRFKLSSPPPAFPNYQDSHGSMGAGANNMTILPSQVSSAPLPRKLQPVAGMKYINRVPDESGRDYHIGFHISKYGDGEQLHDGAIAINKRRSVTSLGSNPMYSSDGPSSPDMELSPKIFLNRDGIIENFDIPPMYQESDENHEMVRQQKLQNGGGITFDPFQGVDLVSHQTGHAKDINNNTCNAHSLPKRSHTSLAFTPNANYFHKSRKESFQKFTNRQSELIKQKSAPSDIRETSKGLAQRHFGLMERQSSKSRVSNYLNSLSHSVTNGGVKGIEHSMSPRADGSKGQT
ncbi:Cytosolic carboxypeptidase 3 [Holothuria leucospilota]|uniref:Cytosolic carboxypeptidase 3 n=1 Tax=Holothuria leucospilota TaxID=206669 RepID=A0A9Q0YG51_HOLLE|nr:Cytosolic carboxypeptidase 3 [Holothuria leucospilota]